MLKMKPPMKTGEEEGNYTTEGDSLDRRDLKHIPRTTSSSSVFERQHESPKLNMGASKLDKETVFEWFGLLLNPAKRIEFMCGLLHMCQPLELRFLGSYLEDLARKDYHILRDFECRANNPSEFEVLTDVIDPVVRSKLLVYLSLLGSDSRECAGIFSRILSSVDLALFSRNKDYPIAPLPHSLYPLTSDGNLCGRPEQPCDLSANSLPAGALEQLSLLFTMASLHPALHFHQREVVRGQLDKIELFIEEERLQRQLRVKTQAMEMVNHPGDGMPYSAQGFGACATSYPLCRRSSCWATQRDAVYIEGIVLRCISQTGTDKEYGFKVKWSDSSSSSVTKTHHELENFLLKLPKDRCTDSFEKSILWLLNQGDHYRDMEMEKNLRERFLSAPPVFRKTRKVCQFFNCDSTYSKPTCCNCQSRKVYQGDCSDASSQEEESYVQAHKKKQGSRSPCQLLSNVKFPQGDARGGGDAVELNGPAERRKISCTLRSNQETGQHCNSEKRSHSVSKIKSRVLPSDRNKGNGKAKGATFMTGGRLVQALSPQRKEGCSGPDTCDETSSESYSSPSSPQHPGPESLDSGDDNNKDTDSHSDDCSKVLTSDMFFTHQLDPAVLGDSLSVHPLSSNNRKAQMPPLCTQTTTEFPALSFISSLPCVQSLGPCNGPPESGLQIVSPPNQSVFPEGKPPGTLMQMPLVPPTAQGPRIAGEPEKTDAIPTSGMSSFGLHPQENFAVHPPVQRFKTALTHNPGGADGAQGSDSTPAAPQASHQAPVIPLSGISSAPTSYSSLLPCQDPASVSSGPPSSHVETYHGLNLPSGMPSPYTLPTTVPTSIMATVGTPVATGIVAGHAQTLVPPAVPTHTPGPATNVSPALTHSTAQTDSISYSNTIASCRSTPVVTGNPIQQTQQQQMPAQQPSTPQQPQQQQPVGCGTCGCYNNCGSRASSNTAGGVSGCQAPLFFQAHQMAAAQQVFSVPPSLIHLTSLCSNNYLTHTHPCHQANSALPPYYPTAPPSPYFHTHSHNHTEVPSHMMGNQAAVVIAAAAAAAANYSLQQQMGPAASFCPHVYPQVYTNPMGMLSAAAFGGGGVNKKNGNVSCYNCGASGHYAQDCNQSSMDTTQQGGFRLKYTASRIADAFDNAD